MVARIVLLVTSPRLPVGLLTAQAWDLVRTHPVFAAAESPQAAALRATGATVKVAEPDAAVLLDAAAEHGTVVWLAGPTGDGDLARSLGAKLTARPGAAEMELVYGSWDPPGARLLDAVAVMDRLRSPGGCPWDAEQTHATLAHYLLEETYEAYDAIEAGDLDALREELGDVLLQVLFHARLAEERPDGERWSVDEVAAELVEKLVNRHPHVFADADAGGDLHAQWDQIKRAEKARESSVDGVALSQPALSLAAKLMARAQRAGVAAPLPSGDDLGDVLLRLVAAARADGLDAEAELRRAALRYADAVRATERRSTSG